MITDVTGYATRCDVCGAVGPVVSWTRELAGTLGSEVRAAATSAGWHCRGGVREGATFGSDLCPEHRPPTPHVVMP